MRSFWCVEKSKSFILYKGGEERLPVQSIFSVRSLYREVPCSGAAEGMVLDVDYVLGKGEITIGRMRMVRIACLAVTIILI